MNAERQVRRIARFGPGGEGLSPWHFTGVHVISPRVFDFMAPEGPEDINRDVYVRMMEAGLAVRGEVVQAYWSDLGTPSRYLATVRDVLFGQVPLERFGAASPFAAAPRGEGNWWAHPEARLGAAKVAGPAYFGAGCALADSARIGSAVSVGPGARVGEGARLNRVAVFEETEVAPGEELVEVLAWGTHRVPAPIGG
jgi:mannose-1-phosphate guanylyltransferase